MAIPMQRIKCQYDTSPPAATTSGLQVWPLPLCGACSLLPHHPEEHAIYLRPALIYTVTASKHASDFRPSHERAVPGGAAAW